MTLNIEHLACVMESTAPPIHGFARSMNETMKGTTERERGEITTSEREHLQVQISLELLDKQDDASPESEAGETFSSSKGFTDSKLPKMNGFGDDFHSDFVVETSPISGRKNRIKKEPPILAPSPSSICFSSAIPVLTTEDRAIKDKE
ncbi:TonB-dependent receptor [Sesbania bispinosa]|nr:TonB-dependent receptor [Sesbania bispinosa]